MRLYLDRLYAAALVLSATGFAAIAGLVLFQILGRLADRVARLIGASPLGLTVPSLAEIGGFLFLGAVFLGLSGTFVRGGHVRVTLLAKVLPDALNRALSVVSLALGLGLVLFATWSSWLQARDSWVFDSVSFGMVRIALWIPQAVMTLGLLVLAVALLDALVTVLRGQIPHYEAAEMAEPDANAEGEA